MSQSDSEILYVTKLHLKGYKSVINCEFELKKGLNIIIGKNGAGKSNLFEFIENVILGHPKEISFQEAKFDFMSETSDKFSVKYKKYPLEIDKIKENPNSRFQINREITINDAQKSSDFLNDNISSQIQFKDKSYTLNQDISEFFSDINYQFDNTLNLKFNLPFGLEFIDNPGIITIDKTNNDTWIYNDTLKFVSEIIFRNDIEYFFEEKDLAKITAEVIHKDLEISHIIQENLNFFSPIKEIRFNKNLNIYTDENKIVIDNVKLEFHINDSWLPWSQLSDGTKRLFYLITEVTSKKTGLILIEEPELGIHPHQFELLMDFIKQESETKQILISTHSPKALDHLNKDELGNILIASYEKGKGTKVRNLTDEEKDNAEKYMTEVGFLSDFWLYSDLEE